ncbi:MAG: hypothetical protein JRI84_02145 [Deltaproteobacteria bacterium]|nr:hypothetical protein [Deltaproteobacteria bacterium]
MGKEFSPFIPEYLKKNRIEKFIPEWIQGSESLASSLSKSVFFEDRPLLLKGGNCIIPFKGIFPFDIKIQDGKIHSIGENLSDKEAFVLELKGKLIAPGIIDPHVHLGIFKDFDVEIVTETKSALLNGVTTLGLYIGGEEPYLKRLDDIIGKIEKGAFCDIFLHLVIFNQKQMEEIPIYYSRYGIKSFKAYMCGIPGLIPEVEDDFLIQLMETVAGLGNDAVLNIHAENYRLVNMATKKLKLAKPLSYSLEEWERSHPGFAEAEAIQRASFLSMQSGARIYFVHLSCKESVDVAKELRRRHKNLYFETTSPYLTLDIRQDTDT